MAENTKFVVQFIYRAKSEPATARDNVKLDEVSNFWIFNKFDNSFERLGESPFSTEHQLSSPTDNGWPTIGQDKYRGNYKDLRAVQVIAWKGGVGVTPSVADHTEQSSRPFWLVDVKLGTDGGVILLAAENSLHNLFAKLEGILESIKVG